jgi:predicted nucleic acid-binding protein
MKIESALQGISRLYLDTAPVVYYVEGVAPFFPIVDRVFQQIESNMFVAITSPVTLSECLVIPVRSGMVALKQDFVDLLTNTEGVILEDIDAAVGQSAAEIRAKYNFKLPDALQIAAAIAAGCEAFLTNDVQLKRVKELRVLVVGELVL